MRVPRSIESAWPSPDRERAHTLELLAVSGQSQRPSIGPKGAVIGEPFSVQLQVDCTGGELEPSEPRRFNRDPALYRTAVAPHSATPGGAQGDRSGEIGPTEEAAEVHSLERGAAEKKGLGLIEGTGIGFHRDASALEWSTERNVGRTLSQPSLSRQFLDPVSAETQLIQIETERGDSLVPVPCRDPGGRIGPRAGPWPCRRRAGRDPPGRSSHSALRSSGCRPDGRPRWP